METHQKGMPMVVVGTDPDFVWQDYLDDTKSEAIPATAFTHVEYSLESGFKVGMKLEILNPDDATTYWLASVIMICGDLLLLRYAGYGDDRSGDIWFNIKDSEFHPVGWCSANKKKLCPPKNVLEKHTDVNSILSKELRNTVTIPLSLSEDLNAGLMPIDKIKCGMKLEVTETSNSQRVWIASIIQNIGGRLLLRYDGSKENSKSEMWMFYLDDRLHPVGYAKDNIQYSPPEELKIQNSQNEWDIVLKQSLNEAKENPFPVHILEPKIPLEKHDFKEGMKLEAVNILNFTDLCPATVTCILDDFHFLVTIDSYENDVPKCVICCNSNNPYIFPVKWCEENELDLKIPPGYEKKISSKFSWDDYLQFCNANAAPPELFPMCFMNMGFDAGMKLEAADPFNLGIIKAATVVKNVDPLLWIHFDSEQSEQKNFISSINSFNIFPVGWCASNSYPLHTPLVYKPKAKLSLVLNEVKETDQKPTQEPLVSSPTGQHSKSWCPKIYFNHRCFTGPLLSKSRLAELPQAIGPGPLHLVIQEVIYRVVNIAYKSSRVLQILQVNGKPTPGMQQQIIKAKYKGKTNRATIEVITNSEQVENFCKNICLKLECCTYLFGPKHVGGTCPSNCHTETKTKFGYNFVKKQKVGRPPSSTSAMVSSDNGDVIKRGPGRRKKRKHWKHLLSLKLAEMTQEEKGASRDSSETDDTSKEKAPQASRIPLVGKKKLNNTPSSSIVTRGAKLPNFGLWHHVTSFHSRRGRPRTRPIRPPLFPPRKVGRPLGSTKKNLMVTKKKTEVIDICRSPSPILIDDNSSSELPSLPKATLLESNPLEWSVEDVVQYLQKTDYAPLAPLLKEQEIDGQALLMLNHFNVQEYLHLKPEPAEKFCYFVKNLKVEFFTHFVT